MQHSGLEAQKRALEEWCKRKGVTGYRVYEDENQSGTRNSRPTLAQLERDLIVRNGLANARAKGKRIGRMKTRPSELIRALLKSDVSHREIARTLKISHGSVSLEKKLMKTEKEAQKKSGATPSAQPAPRRSTPRLWALQLPKPPGEGWLAKMDRARISCAVSLDNPKPLEPIYVQSYRASSPGRRNYGTSGNCRRSKERRKLDAKWCGPM